MNDAGPSLPWDLIYLVCDEYCHSFEDRMALSSTCRKLRLHFECKLRAERSSFLQRQSARQIECSTEILKHKCVNYPMLRRVLEFLDYCGFALGRTHDDSNVVHFLQEFSSIFYRHHIVSLSELRDASFFQYPLSAVAKDMQLVSIHLNCSHGAALWSLVKEEGDIVNAIMRLQDL